MIIFYSPDSDEQQAILTDDECHHCTKVLRKKVGDEVYVTDGRGSLSLGTIIDASKKAVVVADLKVHEVQPAPAQKGIAIAPTKNIDRFEWFLEKATEIGITDVFPFLSTRSERKIIKPDRLQKRIVAAMKQSKNLHLPTLHPLLPLEEILKQPYTVSKYIAHCMEPESALHNLHTSGDGAVVLIGPEGDFTEEEVSMAADHDWREVSLGASRLRTETAGLVACHLLNL